MANCSILWEVPTDAGAWTLGAWAALLPLTNLTTQDPTQVARTTSALASASQFRVDCGVSPKRVFSQFVLLNHNITPGGTIQFVATDSPTDVVGSRIYDSGPIPAAEVTTAWGAQAWGTFYWNGRDPSAYPSGTVVIHTTPLNEQGFFTGYSARYLFVYIVDTGNPAGFIQAGRFLAGSAWQPEINYLPGAGLRVVDPSVKRRTRGGNLAVTKAKKFRTIKMSFPRLSKSEGMGTAFELSRQAGKSREMFVMMDPQEAGNFRFRRSLYGTLIDTEDLPEEFGDSFTWGINIEEIV